MAGPDGAPQAPQIDPNAHVTWEASEYIHRAKDTLWAIMFGLVVVAVLGLSIFLQAWTFAGLVLAMSIAFGVFAFRKPKVKHYNLTRSGLDIDGKFYPMELFRAFSIQTEDAFFSIILTPVKRFMPAIIMYFSEDDGPEIIDILGDALPLEDAQFDIIDAVMRRLHF